MYTLYTIPGSCSTGVHVLMNKLGIPVDVVLRSDVDNYSALVPTNQVPALATGSKILTEGAAISLYLLREHAQSNLPQNPDFTEWLMFNYATLHPAYGKLFGLNSLLDNLDQKQEIMQKLADKVANLWQIVDRHLNGKQFMVNEEPTIVDYLLAVYVGWGNVFPELSIPIGDNVLELVNRVKGLPEFQQAFAAEGADHSIPDNARAA